MADRQEGYGFTKELHDKMAFKYDVDQGMFKFVFGPPSPSVYLIENHLTTFAF